MRTYGYNDPTLVAKSRWDFAKVLSMVLAILFITAVWLALNQKLLFGSSWLSATYDHEDWRTNEGNLHTFGAWDLEAHVWKTDYIMENFPNFHWNPYWYLGMPLLKYYQLGFYFIHWLFIVLTGLDSARVALLMIIFSHLLATLLTFILCYKVSKRIWISALLSTFLLSNTFISLRSYGWEPITVVFLFLYPLGLLVFLKEPLRPFRFWMILVLAASYVSHPLLWFSLCMTMGLYLLSIAVRHRFGETEGGSRFIWEYVLAVFASILVGGIQFIPQISYEQVTSGAHMGVKYLPYYQVPFNIISLKDFFFDAGNLKGPGPIIMIAFFLILFFSISDLRSKKRTFGFFGHELVSGIAISLFVMVLFYYLELYNVFPMNLLRSIQYHRIIPEFIINASVVIAAMSNIIFTRSRRLFYSAMVLAFAVSSFMIIYFVQIEWKTTEDISTRPEFIYDTVLGRISFPYTDQSLSVRNSFTRIPQTYGYYEQGITNAYDDEVFSVSSGFHNSNLTLIYLKAANVGRLYINMEEGERDRITLARMNSTLIFNHKDGDRYGWLDVPLSDPSFAQAVDGRQADYVLSLKPGCRELFRDVYCESDKEEFVSTDPQEIRYLDEYVKLTERQYSPSAEMIMDNPDNYRIFVRGADAQTSVIVKMTHDPDFAAYVDGKEVTLEEIGPQFMLIRPGRTGDYVIHLEYTMSKYIFIGMVTSIVSILGLIIYFTFARFVKPDRIFRYRRGDM